MSTSSPTHLCLPTANQPIHGDRLPNASTDAAVTPSKISFKKYLMMRMMNHKKTYEDSIDKLFEACVQLAQVQTDEAAAVVKACVDELIHGFCGGDKIQDEMSPFTDYAYAQAFLFYTVYIHFPHAREKLVAYLTEYGTGLLPDPTDSRDALIKAQNDFYTTVLKRMKEDFGSFSASSRMQDTLKPILDSSEAAAIYDACVKDIDGLCFRYLDQQAQNERFRALESWVRFHRNGAQTFDSNAMHACLKMFQANRNTWETPKGIRAAVALLVMANDIKDHVFKHTLLELIVGCFFYKNRALKGMLILLFSKDALKNAHIKLIASLIQEVRQAKNSDLKEQLLRAAACEISLAYGGTTDTAKADMLASLYDSEVFKALSYTGQMAWLCKLLNAPSYIEEMALFCKLVKNQCIDETWKNLISKAQQLAAKEYGTADNLETALKIKDDGFFEIFHETMAEPHVLDHTKKESSIASPAAHKAAIATVIQAELNGFHVLSKALRPDIKLELKRKDIRMLLLLLRKRIQIDKDNDHQMGRTGYARDNSEVKLLKELNLGKTRAHPISVTDVWRWFKEDYKASNKQPMPLLTTLGKNEHKGPEQDKDPIRGLDEDDENNTPSSKNKIK